jgi:hypothetical protein
MIARRQLAGGDLVQRYRHRVAQRQADRPVQAGAARPHVELGDRRGDRARREPALQQLGLGPGPVDLLRRRVEGAGEDQLAVGGAGGLGGHREGSWMVLKVDINI